MSYYPEPNTHFKEKIRLVLDLSNFATKEELEKAIGVDTSDLAVRKNTVLL